MELTVVLRRRAGRKSKRKAQSAKRKLPWEEFYRLRRGNMTGDILPSGKSQKNFPPRGSFTSRRGEFISVQGGPMSQFSGRESNESQYLLQGVKNSPWRNMLVRQKWRGIWTRRRLKGEKERSRWGFPPQVKE